MCFLGEVYSCSKAEKKTEMWEGAREYAFLIEVGGILDERAGHGMGTI